MYSCMIGGIVANNSSGMCCGVSQNTYHTLKVFKGGCGSCGDLQCENDTIMG